MKKIALFLILFIVNFSFAKDIVEELQKKFSEIKGFQADITQKTYQSGFSSPDIFYGKVLAVKPDKIKIEYIKPYKQIIYLNGTKVILYSVEENQAIITSTDNSVLITEVLEMIIKNKSIKSTFNVLEAKETNDTYKISLTPKNNAEVKKLELTIDKSDLSLTKLSAQDTDNNIIEVEFEKFKYLSNPVNINFNLPKNVKILNN
jgi:outer membrane lipoprotein carrier protein